MSNAGIAWGTDDVPISGYHPFPAIAHRMFKSVFRQEDLSKKSIGN